MDDSSTSNIPQLNVEAMPSQPTYFSQDGSLRFVPNRIIRKLLSLSTAQGYGLNDIAEEHSKGNFTDAEISQLSQLIGYSVHAWVGMTFVPAASRKEFENQPLYNEHFKPLGEDRYDQ